MLMMANTTICNMTWCKTEAAGLREKDYSAWVAWRKEEVSSGQREIVCSDWLVYTFHLLQSTNTEMSPFLYTVATVKHCWWILL